MVSIEALRTDDAVRLRRTRSGRRDRRAAVRGVLHPLLDDEVFEHFVTVARDSGLPICIYDNPGTTHFRFSNALISRL